MTDSPLARVQHRYRELHGGPSLSAADEAVVRAHFEPIADEQVLADMAAGRVPLPAYLLGDGTPMSPAGHAEPARWAGGVDRLQAWFTSYWPAAEQAPAEQAWADYLEGRFARLGLTTPRQVRTLARLVEQAGGAIDRLTTAPRDPAGRGSLAEATDALDALLAPDTEAERDRRGGATTRDRWVTGPRRDHLILAPPEMPIRTERLVLRRHRPGDVTDIHAYYGREDVATYLLHEPWTRAEFEDRFREWDVPHDRLFGFVLELDGRVVGDMVLMFRGPSQAELGWVIHPDVGGRGLATEAARALLDVGFAHYGFHRIYADLDARNGPSARLCERLGMRREAHRLQDYWSKGEWTDSLQYAVLASEWAGPGQG